jgi:lipoprotein-releasing system ATP-binding protein
MSKKVLLELKDISKTFHQGQRDIVILDHTNLSIEEGEIIGLLGPSGAGKSTLLHIAGLLDLPDSGEVHICGQHANHLKDKLRTAMRRSTIGFIYQAHYLLPEFSALENVIMPLRLNGVSQKIAETRAKELLEQVGLSARSDHRPGKLSGGEQQRVAIARALANEPKLLFADEPTGNLDPKTAQKVFQIFIDVARNCGVSALIATHNHELCKSMDRVLNLEGGHIAEKTNLLQSFL